MFCSLFCPQHLKQYLWMDEGWVSVSLCYLWLIDSKRVFLYFCGKMALTVRHQQISFCCKRYVKAVGRTFFSPTLVNILWRNSGRTFPKLVKDRDNLLSEAKKDSRTFLRYIIDTLPKNKGWEENGKCSEEKRGAHIKKQRLKWLWTSHQKDGSKEIDEQHLEVLKEKK